MNLKKVICLMLTLCMLVSILPTTVIFASDGNINSGVRMVYDFTAFPVDTTLQGITFDNSNQSMQWCGGSSDTSADTVKEYLNDKVPAYKAAAVNINATSGKGYIAFRVKVPKQAKYKVKMTYVWRNNGSTMGVNVLSDTESEASYYDAAHRFIEVDTSNSGKPAGGKGTQVTVISDKVLDTTEGSGASYAGADEVCISIVRIDGKGERAFYLQSVELVEVNPETGEIYENTKPILMAADVTVTSGVLSLDADSQSELCLINTVMSDGTEAKDGDIPEITYVSGDESIITIDGNFAVAQNVGEAEVSAYAGTRYLGKSIICVYAEKPKVEISIPHPYPYLGKGQVVKLDSSADGFTYTSSDKNVATVDENGIITATGVGKVKITASLGDESSSIEIPVVGENLLIRKGVNHGDFENGIYHSDKSIEGMASKDSLWYSKKATGNYIYDFELLNSESHITGEKTNIPKFKVKTAEIPEESGKRTLRMQGGIGQYVANSDNHAGFIVADADKLYEFTGYVKAENVDALPDSIYASLYYYLGQYSSATALTEFKGELWTDQEGEQDWTRFTVPAVYMNWGLEKQYSIDPRFNYSTSSNRGFDLLLSHFSVHEVAFDELEFTLSEDATSVKTYDTFTTSTRFFTNTGNEIVLASTASTVPVTYKSTNETVATVDTTGVITARSNGKCAIIAEAEICGVKKTAEIPLEFTTLGTVLDRLDASVPAEMKLGDSAQIEVKIYNNDDSDYTDGASFYYETKDATVVSVSQEGVLTANNTGKADINVYATVGERTISATYSVVVVDETPLNRAEIVGSNSVEKNFKTTLGIEAFYESGKEVYIPSCNVSFALASNEDATFISVTTDGVVTGISEGTGYVIATVTNRDETITSEPFPVTVVPINPKSQMIDFRIRDFGTVQDATLENQKYTVNKDKTALGLVSNPKLLRFQSYGIQSQNQSCGNNRNADTAFDIFVEYDGWYVPEFMGAQASSGAKVSKLYISGSYIGDYCFYSDNNDAKAGSVASLNPIYLTRGTHTFLLRSYTRGAGEYSISQYPSYLKLNYVSEMSISGVETLTERTSIAIGEKNNIATVVSMSNGNEYIFDLAHGDKKDDKTFVSVESGDTSVVEIVDGRAVGVAEGTTELIITANINELEPMMKKIPIIVTDEKLSRIEPEKSEYVLYKEQAEVLTIKAYVKGVESEEREIAVENLIISYDIGNAVCISLSDATLTGILEGNATITATASLNGVEQSTNVPVTVISDGFETLEIQMFSKVMKPDSNGMQTVLRAYKNTGEEIDISRATNISYDYGDSSIITVDDDGVIHPVSLGTQTLTVTVVIDGIERSTSVDITVRDGKAYSTYYSAEKVSAARENIKKYDWAKSEAVAVIETADKYVDQVDYLYNLIHSEGIPRSYYCGFNSDPEHNHCRYCGKDLSLYGGQYPWVSNAMTRPWKVQCSECKRLFPSNNFGAFYENGLNVHGEFDRTYALEENGILCGRGYRNKKEEYVVHDAYKDNPYGYGDPNGNLYNQLYPELYTTNLDPAKKVPITQGWGNFNTGGESGVPSSGYFWGVDDGLGYNTGREYANKRTEVHLYIPEFVHRGVWYAIGGKDGKISTAVIRDSVKSLSQAYMYTGDKRYGHVAAILLDRIADFYPNFSRRLWSSDYANSDGGTGNGKILGCIWENMLASEFSLAYDAVFDVYDDPEVISYLSEKAEKYQQSNPKTSGEHIRRNFEENFIDVAYEAMKSGDISPNFGGMQRTAAQIAIILDSNEKSQEIIDFIMRAAGESDNINLKTGGDLMQRLMGVIDRDGFPTESALGYNRGWFTKYADIAVILADYGAISDEDNFIKNPKFIKMGSIAYYMQMADARTANIGDHGGTGSLGYSIGEDQTVKLVFDKTEHPLLGQLLYRFNGRTAEGLHMDIFTKDPEAIQDKLEAVIEKYGEIDSSKSTNVTGYGLAALRDGVGFDNVTGTTRDNTFRDWWVYYGGATSHKHADMLNLGLDAFGINYSPDLGYPEQTGSNPMRELWISGTISHNTVVVNEKKQANVSVTADPLHFDDSGAVKVMDIDGANAYPDDVDEYRRTLVSVDVDDSVSYAVDFFRIDGGTEHVYSFHGFSYDAEVQGVELVEQPMGTYAGANVEYGDTTTYTKDSGYNYLKNVSRAENPGTGTFSADFEIMDYYKLMPYKKDWHLKMTMLNDFNLADVSVADGLPPEYGTNPKKLRYVLAKRTGKDLDTLFTTVFEPYIGNSAIKSLDRVSVTHNDGSALTETEKCAAVKVTLNNGRVDYVVYSPDKETTYLVDGLFEFCGFVGVYSLDNEDKPVRTYLLDGTKLGNVSREYAALTGEVVSFTEGNNFDNYITLKTEQSVSPEKIVGKMIDIHNDDEQNGAYMITSAKYDGDTLIIGTGDVGYIRAMKDKYDLSAGFVYNFEIGNRFEIPVSINESIAPVISVADNYNVSAGSSITIPLMVESEREFELVGTTLPRGMNINEETMTLTWKPTTSQIGDNHIAITADNGVFSDTVHFIVTVYGSTTGNKPEIDNNTSDDNSGTSGGGGGGGGDAAPAPDTETTPGDTVSTDKTDTEAGDENSSNTSGETDNIRFTDLGEHSWAEDAINTLADDGIIKGTTASTYSPANNIIRADFALLLVRAFNLTSDNAENFADVNASDYFASELAIARNTGIVNGIGDNNFAPRNTITRQDMMIIVYRAMQKLGVELETGAVDYADFAEVSDYAKDAVSALVTSGLINGKSGKIAPNDYTTRAEVAVFTKRILDYVK